VHFICVGTPQKRNENAADLTYVRSAVDSILPLLKPGDVVVGKSTVPVGTAESVADRVEEREPAAELVWNPEFLREGHAVDDTLHPDRLVYGFRPGEGGTRAARKLDEVYAAAVSNEEFGRFCDAVRQLPVQCRRVFVLKKVYGHSQQEIANQLGIAENTVEKHIAKGMALCLRYMKEQAGEKDESVRKRRRAASTAVRGRHE